MASSTHSESQAVQQQKLSVSQTFFAHSEIAVPQSVAIGGPLTHTRTSHCPAHSGAHTPPTHCPLQHSSLVSQ